jgi:hypothetical protein
MAGQALPVEGVQAVLQTVELICIIIGMGIALRNENTRMKNALVAAVAVGAATALTIYLIQQKAKKKLAERQQNVAELEMVRAPQHAMG